MYICLMRQTLMTIINKIPGVAPYALAAVVVLFISFLFPNQLSFKYIYEEGKRWEYEDITAPFDFAILKSAEELEEEKARSLSNFSPYYEVDTRVVEDVVAAFEVNFEDQYESVKADGLFRDVIQSPHKYKTFGKQFLSRLYDRRIIRLAEEHMNQPEDFVVNIVNGNTSQKQTIENILTVEKAKELLVDSLPYVKLREPDFLYALLQQGVRPNLFYNDTLTNRFKAQMLAEIPTTRGMVKQGETIVHKGEILTQETFLRVASYEQQYEKEVVNQRKGILLSIGYFLLTSLIIFLFFEYIKVYTPAVFARFVQLLFVALLPLIFSYIVFFVEYSQVLSVYLIPFCIVPILIKNFYNTRLALVTHIVVILLASFLASAGYEFILIQLLAGLVVLLRNVDTRNWRVFFNGIIFLFLSYGISYLAVALIQEGEIALINWEVYAWLSASVFLTLLAYPLVPMLERLFGFTSSITLLELSDMNRPLLRTLAEKAPGTLQHSVQVANLAEAAALRIGLDPLLLKVGALYHDIGKTVQPAYFIENNSGVSLHEDLTPIESAKIIISHVTEGVKIAKKAHLPKVIVEFIRTHHGTTRTEYFYRNFIKENPDVQPNETDFCYPGPKPVTKEQTILMIADSVEAACKSLKNPTSEELFAFVDKIVKSKIDKGQLQESELSFQELENCIAEMKKVLKSIYHNRIQYPDEPQRGNKIEK